ncbi:MAG: hypothetical protein KIT69_01940 [Propionibacteriaceae bacterium]|nr:hypothetical protein [Propionibacteriaceae bacterium]
MMEPVVSVTQPAAQGEEAGGGSDELTSAIAPAAKPPKYGNEWDGPERVGIREPSGSDHEQEDTEDRILDDCRGQQGKHSRSRGDDDVEPVLAGAVGAVGDGKHADESSDVGQHGNEADLGFSRSPRPSMMVGSQKEIR